MRRRTLPLLSLVCVAVLCGISSYSLSQETSASPQPASLVPAQTLASVSLWPKSLAESPAMKLAPREVITAAGLENVGIDPLKLERVDVLIGMPGPAGPQFGAVIKSSEAIDLSNLNPDLLASGDMVDDKGFKYLLMDGPEEIIIHQLDDQTVLLGTKFFTKSMVKSPTPKNDVAMVLASIKSSQDALAVVSVKSLRPLLEGFVESAPLEPQVINDANVVINNTEFLALRLLIGSEEKLQLVVASADEATAGKVEVALANILQVVAEQVKTQMQMEIRGDSLTNRATLAYMERVSNEMLTSLRPVKAGNRLVYELNEFQNVGVVGTLTGLLLPAVQSARVAARRMQSSNNLKQLGLAMHNFESTFRMLPATAGAGDDGKPMLSWRVAILPFIEEVELYNKFNLDEPWDSEHNLALLQEMPATYKHPNRNTEPGYTVYQAPVNDQTLLRAGEPSRFQQVTDGLSNTIMLLEVAEERAVPWTAPEDYELDMEDPAAGLFVDRVLKILLGDGSVHDLEEGIDLDVLRALFTRAGGEVVRLP